PRTPPRPAPGRRHRSDAVTQRDATGQAVGMRGPMRVLCTSTSGAGHVHALAPVARALRARGHDVRWAVAADGGDAVGRMGFEWFAAGLTTAARREAASAAVDEIMQLPMAQRRGPLFAAFFAR